MHIDAATISPGDGYKLLTNIVIPRPIAWVTSMDAAGVINLAPFSFFNAMGSNPLLVIISVGSEESGEPKHTARNILRPRAAGPAAAGASAYAGAGEFVVNLVTEDLIDAMTVSAADFPQGDSELSAAGLHAAPSVRVAVPRVAEAQASLECTLHSHQRIGANNLIIGQVLAFNIADVLLGERLRVNGFTPIGRLGSPSMYCRTADRFDYPRVSYAQWINRKPDPKITRPD
ncbi:MAG: flavin reductase family protein [Burkholderiales bacterium]|nr:flavin reductase family protein [Phycisphaerae bacterium]